MGEDNVTGRKSLGDLLPLTPVALNVCWRWPTGNATATGSCWRLGRGPAEGCGWGRARSTGRSSALKEGGVIEESGERPDPGEAPDDERRRYYRLTGFGGEVLAAEVERLDGLVRAARRKGAFPAPKPGPPKPSPEGA